MYQIQTYGRFEQDNVVIKIRSRKGTGILRGRQAVFFDLLMDFSRQGVVMPHELVNQLFPDGLTTTTARLSKKARIGIAGVRRTIGRVGTPGDLIKVDYAKGYTFNWKNARLARGKSAAW